MIKATGKENSTGSESFPEAFADQQARLRRIHTESLAIGPAGSFLCATINGILGRAERASASGDTVAMVKAFKEMTDIKG